MAALSFHITLRNLQRCSSCDASTSGLPLVVFSVLQFRPALATIGKPACNADKTQSMKSALLVASPVQVSRTADGHPCLVCPALRRRRLGAVHGAHEFVAELRELSCHLGGVQRAAPAGHRGRLPAGDCRLGSVQRLQGKEAKLRDAAYMSQSVTSAVATSRELQQLAMESAS